MKIWNYWPLILIFCNIAYADMNTKKATFAGGCFWCMEKPFEELDGVTEVISGYSGGKEKDPTYRQVSSGSTGHAEVIQVTYNPEKVSYKTLLDVFWKNIDPTTANRQFCDVGSQYRTAIFYHDKEQEELAKQSKTTLEKSDKFPQVATEIAAASEFYPAEDYHQNYYKKNPIRYKMYRTGCGRDARLKDLWGKDK